MIVPKTANNWCMALLTLARWEGTEVISSDEPHLLALDPVEVGVDCG